MKIIVDKLPKTFFDCPFAKYEYVYYQCELKKDTCDLEHNRKCEMLLSMNGGE